MKLQKSCLLKSDFYTENLHRNAARKYVGHSAKESLITLSPFREINDIEKTQLRSDPAFYIGVAIGVGGVSD